LRKTGEKQPDFNGLKELKIGCNKKVKTGGTGLCDLRFESSEMNCTHYQELTQPTNLFRRLFTQF
jgi:hypothetical protein